MAKLKLLNTIFSKLGSLTKNNGQIIVTRDSKSLYVDLEGERIEITDWIDIDTEESLLAILTPLINKYYYTKDTNKIWRYIGGEWKYLNDSADDLAPTYTESSTLLKLSSGEKLSVAFGKISKAITDLISHIGDSVKHITSTERTNWNSAKTHADSAHARTDATKVEKSSTNGNIKINGAETTVYTHPGGTNPHGTTKSDVGLGNVDNTKDIDKPISTKQQEKFDELSSNLDTLSYGENGGSANLFDKSKIVRDAGIGSGGSPYGDKGWGYSDYIHVEPNTEYTFMNVSWFNYYDANKSHISQSTGGTSTTPSNAKYVIVSFQLSVVNSVMVAKFHQTEYVPYVMSNYQLTQANESLLDIEFLGWTVPRECPVQNYVDSDGIFHQRVDRVDLGNLEWKYKTTWFHAFLYDSKPQIDGLTKANIYCSAYDTVIWSKIGTVDKTIGVTYANDHSIGITDTSYTDATTFRNEMKGKYLYYELEEEILIKIDGNEVTERINENLDQLKNDLTNHESDTIKHITSTERTNWNSAKTHADSAHAPSNAQVNVIETIKVNGTALTPSSKAVNITIPTNNNQLTNGAGYITSSGTAKTISDTLPISKGGTGQTTAVNAANTLINSLLTGESTPTDADYYISQYVGGGTKITTYHRRPMSALWNYIKSKLATVATSGSYNDLTNKPTIPTVGNGTITIKQAGASKGTFTMNQTGNTTIELTDNNTTYGVATSSVLGLVKSGTDITVDSSGNVSVNDDSHNHVISNVDGLQSALDGKAASSHQQAYTAFECTTYTSDNNTMGITPAAVKKAITEVFEPKSHTHNYAGSSSAGGSANSSIIPYGFNHRSGNAFWGNQTGTYVTDWNDSTGGSIQFRRDNPISGQLSALIDGYFYQREGQYRCLDTSDSSSFAAASHTHSNYLTGITKDMITTALGYTPPTTDTNTWRGIQNNLTSDSTTDSLSAAQGKVLNEYKMDRSAKQGLGYSNTIDLSSSSYDVNTYYPVILSNTGRGFNHIVVDVQLDSGTKPSWSTHSGGFSCYMDILAISAGWGTITPLTICLGYTSSFTYNNENPCGYSQLTNSSIHVVWLRGGGKYFLFTDFNTVPTVITSEYTVSYQSVKPEATKPFSFTYSTIYANVTNSNYATSAGNSDTVDGFHASQTAGSKSTCVVTDSNGYTNLNYINSNTSNSENPSISQIIVTNGSDNFYRKASLAHLKSSLGSMPASDVYAWAKASSKPSYSWSEITNKPSSFTPVSHNHELIIDSNNKETPIYITYSKDELAYDGFTYLTAWYGYELRKIPKTLFATASHTHSYLPLSGGTVSGTITADNLQSKNGLTLTNTYSTADASIKCYWKDNSLHEIVTRNSNGLSSYFGWAGSSRYSTTTWLRGQTCKYQNASGTATISDVRMKKDFRGLDVYDKFFDAIEPCAFRMTNGSSGRYHIGYKAQQIEQALIDSGLTTQDFAGFIRMPYTIDKEDKNGTKAHEEAGIKEGDDELSIIYTEFAAMNTYQIQKCKKEISNLKNEIAELKNIISNLNA